MARKPGYRMMQFMSRHMIACDEASFLISRRQDQRLGIKKRWQLKMHLITCHLCRKYASQIRQLGEVLEGFRTGSGEGPSAHHLSAEATEKIRKTVSGQLGSE